MKKGYFILTAAVIAAAGIAAVTMLYIKNGNSENDMVYDETMVKYGTLTVGVTKTAPLSIRLTEQTFELDVSALTGDSSAALQVDEVLVSAGQQVHKGTALFRVTAKSAQNARTALQREILEANKECELLEKRQKELRLKTAQGYDNEVMDGKYAGLVYSNKCEELQKKADEAKEAVDRRQNQINENLSELTQIQDDLAKAQKYLREAENAVSENYSERYENAYYYTVYENTRENARKMVEQLEGQLESLTEKNDLLLYEIDEATRAYHQIVQEMEQERLAAKLEYDTEIYGSEMAPEWYDIQMASLDSALQEAAQTYQTALQNIRLFDACIVNGKVVSAYNGVIADIMAEAGDTIEKNDILVTLYDQEAVTMEVFLHEEEYLAVNKEESVNISFSECSGIIYEGGIAQVSDVGGINDLENPRYAVTVTIQGDVSDLHEGMTGEVTFLTNDTKEVLYVPRRAVFTEDKRSYVKLRDKRGNIVQRNVTTGSSDGIHIEIVKGISEGDTVLVAVS